MPKRKYSSKSKATFKRRKLARNVTRGERVKTSVLSNGVRGRVSKNSAIHKRTYRGRYRKPSRKLRRAKRGNVGTKPSTIITTQMMNYKVLPNQKGVLGLMSAKLTCMDPYNTSGASVELGGGYQIPDYTTAGTQICDKYSTYESMLADTTTEDVFASHRTDWCMFNNNEWRDNLCYLLGLFNTTYSVGAGTDTQPTVANPTTGVTLPTGLTSLDTTGLSTGANGTAMWGYMPPNTFKFNGTLAQLPYGLPVPYVGTSFSDTVQNNYNQPGWAAQQHYVLSESITWYVHNQGATDLTVILNECTLKYDIPLINGRADDNDIVYGGMVDPLELWKNSRSKQAFSDKNNSEFPSTKSSIDARDYWQGYSPNKDRLNNDITDIANSTKYADRLNAMYSVKKHFQVIKPGQTAHFKVKVAYNARISPHQITNMFAIGGKSKTFFFEFLTRPTAAGNITNATAANGTAAVITGRGIGRPPADVSIKWTKAKRFLLDQRMPTNTLNIRAARPAYKYFGVIESDGDRKTIITNATNDGNETAENINTDAVNEINGAMGGFIDINMGDITIF